MIWLKANHNTMVNNGATFVQHHRIACLAAAKLHNIGGQHTIQKLAGVRPCDFQLTDGSQVVQGHGVSCGIHFLSDDFFVRQTLLWIQGRAQPLMP